MDSFLKITSILLLQLSLLLSPDLAVCSTNKTIKDIIQKKTGANFATQAQILKTQFENKSLLEFAKNKKNNDQERSIALIALGDGITVKNKEKDLLSFLKDRSWLIKNTTLKIIGKTKDNSFSPTTLVAIQNLTQDEALVVRSEVLSISEKAIGQKTIQSIVFDTLRNKANYYKDGRPIWPIKKAINLMVKLKKMNLPLTLSTEDRSTLKKLSHYKDLKTSINLLQGPLN